MGKKEAKKRKNEKKILTLSREVANLYGEQKCGQRRMNSGLTLGTEERISHKVPPRQRKMGNNLRESLVSGLFGWKSLKKSEKEF
jgi:hypothetical protein